MGVESRDFKFRVKELEILQDGWLDGQGKALNRQGLKWFVDIFSRLYSNELPFPYVYPTIEGNIQLEWSFGTREISLEVSLEAHTGEWHDLDVLKGNEERKIINFNDEKQWEFICEQIKAYKTEK